MKTAVRTPFAAAMLLLPLGAAFLAQPVHAQQRAIVAPPSIAVQVAPAARPVAPGPVIERFTVRPQGRLSPGRELRFRLEGVAGGDASLDIPGVVSGIDLRETRRGVYEGSYTVRRRDDLSAFDRAVATLRVGNQRAVARVDLEADRDHGRDRRDERAPQISNVNPGNGDRVDERGRTLINARLSDVGSGVDAGSVRLVVDGLDVTRNARVSEDEIAYRERLGRGQHRAELSVRDRAGNTSRAAWTFRVV
jgi:hypothetical protein